MGLPHIVIDSIRPTTTTGRYPAKATVGQASEVSADIFRDGHDVLAARVRWKGPSDRTWKTSRLELTVNDRWSGTFVPQEVGEHTFDVEAWTDTYATWRHDIAVRHSAGQDVAVELQEGRRLLEAHARKARGATRRLLMEASRTLGDTSLSPSERLRAGTDPDVAEAAREHPLATDRTRSERRRLWVDRELAGCGAWYELFPRSYGGFEGTMKRFPYIIDAGFDIVYFPPIHPIGRTHRKGRDNVVGAGTEDPGSPWAIGGEEGGHTAIHPDLGTIEDFDRLIAEANSRGLEVALDYALQCSPDHPWVTDHPEWFHRRPDGSIRYAENPPKRYQDIYPINFWPEEGREELWEACKEILEYWISHGVRVFRVDNPHTKPVVFWEWLIGEIRSTHPEVVFLSEAFTRPKMMAKLAEVGFTQSYTYFTWRRSKQELTDYLNELARSPLADFFRPNFWPNTPDILSHPLREGAPSAFKMRFTLAATMSPNYGVYSGYELCENQPASEENEEYRYSEKYEIKERDFEREDSIIGYMSRINDIRRRHPALRLLANIRFHRATNDQIIVYSKATPDLSDVMLMVVNLDPNTTHEATLGLDFDRLGMVSGEPFEAHDEITGQTFVWSSPDPYVRLDPSLEGAHVLHLRRRGDD